MSVPLYQAKAEMFRTLGHPVRIRVLELLQDGPRPVRDLLAEIDVEASNLSQQLAVLRRVGIVTSYRDGPLVMYALSTPTWRTCSPPAAESSVRSSPTVTASWSNFAHAATSVT